MEDLFSLLRESFDEMYVWSDRWMNIMLDDPHGLDIEISLFDNNITVRKWPFFGATYKVSLANPNYKEDIVNYIRNMEKLEI